MKNDMDTQSIASSLKPIIRYHYLVFIFVVLGLTGYVVLSILSTINPEQEDSQYRATKVGEVASDKFDETTINQIRQFKSSNEQSADVTLPEGKINPFSE